MISDFYLAENIIKLDMEQVKTGAATSQAEMARKKFEFENEIIEEQLFKFSEEEVDKLMIERPWTKK